MYVNGKVVSTDCETGPNEIITHKKDGFLVGLDNPNLMADAIESLVLDEVVRETFYTESRKKILAFTQSKMIDLFKESIDEVGH
jgi:glycosyltransferase involved in cell wall biosynthesis